MKKILVCLATAFLILSITACGNMENGDANSNQVESNEVISENPETTSSNIDDIGSGEKIEFDNKTDFDQNKEDTADSTSDGVSIPMDDLAEMLEKRLNERLVNSTIQVVALDNELSIVFSLNDINCTTSLMAYAYSEDPDEWKDITDIVTSVYDAACAYCDGAGMGSVPINVIWVSEDDINEFYFMISNGDVTFDCVELFNSVSESYITKEKYDRVTEGMKYSEVVDLIGSEGVLSAESSVSSITIKIYTWTAEDGIGTASISFQNDIVVAKSQAGLE